MYALHDARFHATAKFVLDYIRDRLAKGDTILDIEEQLDRDLKEIRNNYVDILAAEAKLSSRRMEQLSGET